MIAVRMGVAALLVAVMAGCGSSTPTPTTPTTPATPAAVTVTILSAARTLGVAAYVPNPVMVAVGAKLTWSNTDTTTHDMVSDTGVWDSGRIAGGSQFDFTFQTKGSFPYHCSLHPGMVGTVVVQ
ncbi:MAG TPA: plastocyanin/azurin family copper-binding protein [Vicinamibacterales bacterium]|jgi:plastocyanin|nr:plastocyanin/azurin family copper-binding protein [Vicinamibacterales bacterium]